MNLLSVFSELVEGEIIRPKLSSFWQMSEFLLLLSVSRPTRVLSLCLPCLTSQKPRPSFSPPCLAMKVKSKKERLKRLCLVGTGSKNWRSSEMGRTVVCYNKDDGPTDGPKRLKLSRKLLNGYNVAGKTTVPRKLRTAMKKRNCDSPSSTLTDLKKPSCSTRKDGSPEQNVVKKSKREVVLNLCPGKSLSGPMTKDEQEVAEVLFAMASMFSDSGASQDVHCRHISAQTDKLVLSDAMECSITAEEGMKPEFDFSVHSMKKETAPTSLNEGNHGEVTSDEPVINRINLQDKQPSEELARKEEPSTGTWSRSEISTSKVQIACNTSFKSESCIDLGLERSEESMQAVNWGTPKLNEGLASCSGSQLPYPSFLKGFANKAPPAWSIGLPMVSNGSSNLLEMSTSKMPNWIDASIHPQRPTSKGASHSKVSKNTVARIPRKRCVTHVRISYLIQELRGRDMKDSVSMQYLHMKPEMDANISLRRLRTCGSNGVTLDNTIEVKPEPIFNEFKSGIPSLETTPKEKQLQNLRSVVYKPEKQVYDFLSLSSGESVVDPDTGRSRTRTGNMSGMSSYLCLSPISTRGVHQPIPTSNNHFPHVNQASAAGLQQVQLQLSTHLGNYCSTLPQKGPCILTKEQQKQQQQMLWATMAHRQGLQVKLDHATGMQCSLPMVPSFPVTHFPKYTAKVPQHHPQQLASLPWDSMSCSSSKRPQDHRPPAGVQFYAGALSPQLLCNKHL